MERVLIIGGGGYIGPPVASFLLNHGYAVRNFDNFLYPTQLATAGLLLHDNYEQVVGDLTKSDQLEQALKDVQHVVILAGLVGDPITKKFPTEAGLVNDKGIQDCLNALSGKGLGKAIFVSTCSNYGLMEGGKLATEESELKPLSLYAKSKVDAEQLFLSKKDEVDYSGVVLRFATAFGAAPRMRFDLTVNEFTRELWAGNELVVFDADTWRPYCHVRDFARLILKVIQSPKEAVNFEVFNAGGEANNHTKRSVVSIIEDQLPNCNITYQEHGGDPRNYRVNFDKVKSHLGFEPKYSVEAGVAEIVALLDQGYFSDFSSGNNFFGNYSLTYPK